MPSLSARVLIDTLLARGVDEGREVLQGEGALETLCKLLLNPSRLNRSKK